MKFCQNCGTQLSDTDKFCVNCGYRFPETAPADATPAPVPETSAETATAETPVYSEPAPTSAPEQAYYQAAPQPAPAPYAQAEYTTPAPEADTAKSKAGKITGLSIAAFILSLLGCTSIIGLILGIVDVTKKDGRKKGLSIAAIIIGAIFTLSTFITVPVSISIMGPSLSRYTEKTNVSSDMQYADSIKTALQSALLDPSVIANDTATVDQVMRAVSWSDITTIGSPADSKNPSTVRGAFEEIMGTDIDDLTNHIKSHHSPDARIMYKVTNGNQIDIMITTTDRTAGKDNDPEDYISTAPFGAFDYEYDDEFFYDDLDDVYFDDDFDDYIDDDFDFDW